MASTGRAGSGTAKAVRSVGATENLLGFFLQSRDGHGVIVVKSNLNRVNEKFFASYRSRVVFHEIGVHDVSLDKLLNQGLPCHLGHQLICPALRAPTTRFIGRLIGVMIPQGWPLILPSRWTTSPRGLSLIGALTVSITVH